MTALPLILAPDPIFKKKSIAINKVDDKIRKLMDDMLDTIYLEHGVGIAAPMVGELLQVITIDLQVNGEKKPLFMANPVISFKSDEQQSFSEGSLCFPGIKADVTRSSKIKVDFINYNNEPETLEAEGFLSQVIQHEIDYLAGIIFLDYLTKLKRDMLISKMQKYKKKIELHHSHHVHNEHCNH
jgi:peptide deformylase